MKKLWRFSVLLLVAISACRPSGDGSVSSTSIPIADVSTTSVSTVETSTTTPETTTTTVDPTGEFLEAVSEVPSVTAFTEGGFRRWERGDGEWSPGPLVRYEGGPFDVIPTGASTPAGVVYGSPDGAVHLVEGEDDSVVVTDSAVLYDVTTSGDAAPIAIVGPAGISAVDLGSGAAESVYDSRVEAESASYGGGRIVLIRGTGAEAVPLLVDSEGRSLRLDLLADGNPVSAVLSPDGARIIFSADGSSEATVYTLALGSQGPAAPYPLGVEGTVTRLDTDGTWVAGLIGDRPFLLDVTSGEVFFGPEQVRFVFDRNDRIYVGSGTVRIIDGRFFGWIRSATPGSIQFDDAEFLTGDDAVAAAEDAGEESPPPNDYFIRNTSENSVRIPLVDGVEIRVQANFPEAGIDWEAITLDQWLRLLQGDLSAVEFDWYGQGTLPYWITIEEGRVVLLEEVYLP